MSELSNYMSILSSDFLYISIFISLSYIIGSFISHTRLKYPDFNSLSVGIPWFIVVFIFTASTLSKSTGLGIHTFVVLPICILMAASFVFIYIKRNKPLSRYVAESTKLAVLKPIISLSAMLLLRDVFSIPQNYIIYFALLTYTGLLALEILNEKMNISLSGLIYNMAALFMLVVSVLLYKDGQYSSIAPIMGGGIFGILSTLLYSLDKSSKRHIVSDDLDLFSRFEELVSEGQFQTAVDMTEDGLWEFNLEADEMNVSKPLQSWLGLDSNIIKHAADFWISRVHPQDWSKLPDSWIPEDFQSLRTKLRSLNSKNHEFEIRLESTNGMYKWVRVRFQVAAEGMNTVIHGSFKDVDQEIHAKAQITQLSLYDMTTGLPNFASMLKHLNEAIDSNEKHAILSLNIDNFKIINDLMGFFTGDEVLGKISKRLAELLPEHAHIFRFGGDEFVIITNQPNQAEHLADLILSEFDGKLDWKETHLRITCSIGISHFPTSHAYDEESILKCSDIALEFAKNHGKNRFAVFNNKMMDELEQRHNLINALENSHMSENFEVYYQPLMKREATEAIHVEALLRWTWKGSKISPARFIPVAEETGLIIPIGKMVLDQVCRDIAYMQALGKDMRTSINVSAVQLLHPTFIPSITQAIEAHCIDPKQLTIEITETSLIHDITSVRKTLSKVSGLGIRISLDDFGTGFSSLSHIIELPIDELKLDRTFIHNFHKDLKRQNVISNIIQLAHGMGLTVVAEGVEVEAECSLLEKYGCDVCQGYYYAYPMPLIRLISEHPQSA